VVSTLSAAASFPETAQGKKGCSPFPFKEGRKKKKENRCFKIFKVPTKLQGAQEHAIAFHCLGLE